ncbi:MULTISPECIES: membrane lipoprotein lipid attachment site-containing protein [unclassified Serratia (in: enterobacteria)]|uniref:membrane lipoprotein lipid attachment site-containing protein n=1 Tax=unclassified Serratia (in: enterobacteria) TaxID=2647522 RepID=UPI003075FE1E
MRKLLFALVATAILSGCASSPVPLSDAKTAPADRVFLFQSPKTDSAEITIIRDGGVVGSACLITAYINGQRVANLESKEKAAFYVSPGELMLGAAFEGAGLCNSGKSRQEREVVIKKGQQKVFRIYTGADAELDIKPSSL